MFEWFVVFKQNINHLKKFDKQRKSGKCFICFIELTNWSNTLKQLVGKLPFCGVGA